MGTAALVFRADRFRGSERDGETFALRGGALAAGGSYDVRSRQSNVTMPFREAQSIHICTPGKIAVLSAREASTCR